MAGQEQWRQRGTPSELETATQLQGADAAHDSSRILSGGDNGTSTGTGEEPNHQHGDRQEAVAVVTTVCCALVT